MGVNDPKAQPILENAKKSVFDSVLVNTERTGKIFHNLVGQGDLKYTLTHKISPEDGETFFRRIRG